jgi:hypothetical protein
MAARLDRLASTFFGALQGIKTLCVGSKTGTNGFGVASNGNNRVKNVLVGVTNPSPAGTNGFVVPGKGTDAATNLSTAPQNGFVVVTNGFAIA